MIIHFWQLPENRTYITVKNNFKMELIKILETKKDPWKIRNKIKNGKISIKKIKLIAKKENILLEKMEKKIAWIGGKNSKGLFKPNFPINFSSREGARFIAAIVNDGTLTKEKDKSKGKIGYGRLMYDNFDKSLRRSAIKDYPAASGGKNAEIASRDRQKKKCLEFSSVIRDIIELVIKEKGPKCESNIRIPEFIFRNKETMVGWIEQTIADEGEVKYYPRKYRRSIIWRRSLDITSALKNIPNKEIALGKLSKNEREIVLKQKCNLTVGEEKILDLLRIIYKVYNLGIYPTVKNKIRTRWQISITKRENLLKLRNLIKIPSEVKNAKFSLLVEEFVRYKEPLKVKETIIKLGKEQNSFSSLDLKKKLNYKETNVAIKWLKIFEKQGLIKKTKESEYGNGDYRKPAEYQLILNK